MRTHAPTTSLVLALSAALAVAPLARAQLLVNPAGGSTITSVGDDVTYLRSLANPFTFYGASHGTVYVSTNGNLNFSGSNQFSDATLGGLAQSAGPVVAPMFDDILLSPGTISDLTSPFYYAVTYEGVGTYGNPGTIRTFQTVLFTDAVTIGNFDFHAGDIAFSYGSLVGPVRANTATVGVALDANTFTPLPGTTDGTITTYSLLPTTDNQFVLFRGGSDGYQASIQSTTAVTATPEPATMALLGTGLVGLFGAAGRRMRGRARSRPTV